MRSFALASGSSGNCFYVESTNGTKFLVDIGLSFKRVSDILSEKNISPQEISGLFITHEHADHICGLEVFIKNTNCNIYITKGTYDMFTKEILNKENSNLDKNRFIFISENEILKFEDIKILVVPKSHDAKEPVSFVFENGGGKIGIFTDLGFVNSQSIEILKKLDIIYFEANFCEDFLKQNNFSIQYVNRLHSDLGHLSLKDTLEVLTKISNNNQKIILSHISENTNSYENAYIKVKNHLNKLNLFPEILVSFQGEPSDWIE